MDHTDVDVVLHGTYPDHIEHLLTALPEAVVLNFYQLPDGAADVFLAHRNSQGVEIERIRVLPSEYGRTLAVWTQLIQSLSPEVRFDGGQSPLLTILTTFGDVILPRIAKLTPQLVILIPHGLLHVIPLHMMIGDISQNPLMLDSVSAATLYASSVCTLLYSDVQRRSKRGRKGSFLACVDTANLSAIARLETEWYEHIFAGSTLASVVTDVAGLPADYSRVLLMIWSSHARSDPLSWENSCLCFGNRRIKATEIMQDWDFSGMDLAILAGCETGVALPRDTTTDEYCGLDMAAHLAGASCVVSSMWALEERVAVVGNILLLEHIVETGEAVPVALRWLRCLLMSGKWRDLLKEGVQLTKKSRSLSPARRRVRLKLLDAALSLPGDAFEEPFTWGVLRCFGQP